MRKLSRTLGPLVLALVLLCVAFAPQDAWAKGAKVDLKKGTYTVEVTLEGGTGRASIDSPTLMYVENEHAEALIEWSSPNYDYMIVDGTKYLPCDDEGNSTFKIPVLAFDKPFEVVADTTAMSTPHEITYHLTFDSQSLHRKSKVLDYLAYALPIILVIVVGTTFYHVRKHP